MRPFLNAGQLPQINKKEDHGLLNEAHVFLDQVMRQAEGSEIIQLTMKIRAGEQIPYFKGNEVQIIKKNEMNTGLLLWSDVIISATNRTRHHLNQEKRKLLGREGELAHGDQIIVKRNYWDDNDSLENPLVNGTIATVLNPYDSFIALPQYIDFEPKNIPTYNCDLQIDGSGYFEGMVMDRNFLLKEEPLLDWSTSYKLSKMRNVIGDIIPKHLTYGYALTCHAAQGSEWPNVLVVEETFPFDPLEHARWLYTACTRAVSRLVLVR